MDNENRKKGFGFQNHLRAWLGTLTALLVIVGLVATGMGYFSSEEPKQDEGDQVALLVEQESGQSVDESPQEPVELFTFLIERLPVPVRDANDVIQGYRFLDFVLTTHSASGHDVLVANISSVQDAFVEALAREGIGRAGAPGEIDTGRVSAYLQEAANTVLGRNIVQQVEIAGDPAEQ